MEENILEKFYDGIRKQCSLTDLGIPPSKVFFVRRAIEDRTGLCFPVQHIECSLFLEGHLDPDRFFANGLPVWYVDKYLNGKHPDMDVLRDKLRIKYQQHLASLIPVSAELEVIEADTGEGK
jgi:hypothetical protein